MADHEAVSTKQKSRDPRKRFLRAGSRSKSQQPQQQQEGRNSCSESEFDVSSPSGQSVCSSTSYPGSSARSPAVVHDLSCKSSVRSPESPLGGPLSFPSLGPTNSPFSDVGPLSVSEFLKSPGSSVADPQDGDIQAADSLYSLENKLGRTCADHPENLSSPASSSLSTGRSDTTSSVSSGDRRPHPDSSPSTSYSPQSEGSNGRSKPDADWARVPSSSGQILDRLLSAERKRHIESLYLSDRADRNRDIFEPPRLRTPRNERYSPGTKEIDSTNTLKIPSQKQLPHQLSEPGYRGRDNAALGSSYPPASSGSPVSRRGPPGHGRLTQQPNASGSHHHHPSPGHQRDICRLGMKDFTSDLPPNWNPREEHAAGKRHLAMNHEKALLTMASEQGRPDYMDLQADALSDQMAIEMLRQEVFKRTSLDLPREFPWYPTQRQNSDPGVSCGPAESSPKRAGYSGPGGMTTREEQKGQYGVCVDLSSSDPRVMPAQQAGMRGMNTDGGGGGGGREGHRPGPHDSQVSTTVPTLRTPAPEEKTTRAAESTSADIDIHVCQICGDVAAGFHCGAYVCEACKKFFVRCLKQESGIKFVCPRNKRCNITKETRTQCQHCRYQKCLSIGMYRPGGANISSEICHIPCNVCGAPSSGYHFGAITCEGCKGFFRRTIKERDSMKYQCSRNATCTITTATRNVCKFCRYRKCLDVGMKADGSRIGRQPNSVKHATMIQLKQIKTSKGLETGDLPVRIEGGTEPVFPKQEPEMDSGYGVQLASVPREQGMLHRQHSYPEVEPGYRPGDMIRPGGPGGGELQCAPDMHGGGMPGRERNFPVGRGAPHHPGLPEPRGSLPYPPGGHISQEVPFGHLAELQDSISDMSSLFSSSSSQSAAPVSMPTHPSPHPSSHPSPRSTSHPPPGGDTYSRSSSNHERSVPMETDSSCVSSPPVSRADTMETGSNPPSHSSSQSKESEAGKPTPALDTGTPDTQDLDRVIAAMENAIKYLEPIKKRAEGAKSITADMDHVTMWETMMAQFSQSAHSVLRFAKKVPGFKQQPIQEQISVVQTCMYPIVLTILSMFYDLETRKYNYFHMSDEEQTIQLENFPPFNNIVPSFHSVGLAIKQISMDWTEVSFLCALHLLGEGSNQDSQALLVSALERYCKKIYGEGSNRHGLILLRLGDLVKANLCHQKAVMEILSQPDKFKEITIPRLFEETFINT